MFDGRQLRWANRLLPYIPDLPVDTLRKVALDRGNGGFGLLLACVVAALAYVGSKADTAHAVAQFPGQSAIEEMTAGLSSLLSAIYAEHDVIPAVDLLLTFLLQKPGHNQKPISGPLKKRRAAKFWPSEEVETSTQPVQDQIKLARYKSITTDEARAWPTILPGEYEIPSSTWCTWLQVWLGAAVYDLPPDGFALICRTCKEVMGQFGHHLLSTCTCGYGRNALHNAVARVAREEAVVKSGVPSTFEQTGLMPDAGDRPGDFYVTNNAGYMDTAYASAAFDFTVHGSVPDNGESSADLVRSCKTAGAAAIQAEKTKTTKFLKRKNDIAFVLKAYKGIYWNPKFQFRPFGMDVYGSMGPEAKKAVEQFSKLRASRFNQSPGLCRRKFIQAINVALISENVKTLA